MAKSLRTLQNYKKEGRKFSVLTSYDASFARLMSDAGIDALLVGDSLGNVIQGQTSTLPVTLEHMVYHTANVARGNRDCLILADLPFMTAATHESTLNAADQLMRAGANVVKLEGGLWLQPAIEALAHNGVPSCVHLGLTPQSVNSFGGYRVQGRDADDAQHMLDTAVALDRAGAALFVLECIPAALGARISAAVDAPVISCGAGPDCDGQVVVSYDMLGLSEGQPPKFVKNFMADSGGDVSAAIRAYHEAIVNGDFPTAEHCY